MFFNYLKLAIRVLGRKKFFTAITLFGISFTLAILMLIVSVLETEVGKTKPITDKDKMVIASSLQLKKQFYDTLYVYDTIMVSGDMTIDTSFTTQEAGTNNSNNQYAFWFLEKYLDNVPNAEKHSFFSANNSYNAYVNNSKVEIDAIYADAGFWDVFDFDFLEGFGFGASSVEQGELVAVITTDLADRYFGRKSDVLGEEITMDGKTFKITGLVKPPGVSLLSAGIVVPHTLLPQVGRNNEDGFGGVMGVFVGANPDAVDLIKDDIKFLNSSIPIPPNMQQYYNEIIVSHSSFYEIYADSLLDMETPEESLKYMRWIMMALLSLFILLPTLNLINLNVSRILERSSEIGVRKAFGADRTVLLTQFIVENVVQTFIGGLIGLGLALLMMYLINDAKLMGDVILKVNYRFFIYSFLICILFGVVSGFLPAYRMSKLHVVSALKSK